MAMGMSKDWKSPPPLPHTNTMRTVETWTTPCGGAQGGPREASRCGGAARTMARRGALGTWRERKGPAHLAAELAPERVLGLELDPRTLDDEVLACGARARQRRAMAEGLQARRARGARLLHSDASRKCIPEVTCTV